MHSSIPNVALFVLGLFVAINVIRGVNLACRKLAVAEEGERLTVGPSGLALFLLLLIALQTLYAGTKREEESVVNPPGEEQLVVGGGDSISGGGSQTLTSGPNLTASQYAAGFALVRVSTNASPWLVPSNAVQHEPWTRFGLAEDTFWLPATDWGFVLGTNAVDGVHVSSSGTLSFWWPKGSPRAAQMPDGDTISFLAPLQTDIGTVPPSGRFWHAVTASNSVLFTWQDVFAGRDTNSTVSFQAELFWNGDFTYRYAFTNALSLTNFVIGAQHNGGGETYALDDTNLLVNGLELRWRAFGMLDPNVYDHDGDGLSTYDELMKYGTDPTVPDTDLDGLGDAAEVAIGSNPLVRCSRGDGIPDGSNPQSLAWNKEDANANGLPDAWENYWFGTNGTAGAYADDNGDGFSNLANLLTGTDPAKAPQPGFAVTNGVPVPGIDVWEIAPVFALETQPGLTNILKREIHASRTSPWQQFFISSTPRAAGAWSLDGLSLSWESGTNISGAAAASPSGDSLRLGLSSNLFETLTIRIAPSRETGLARSARPLYLVRWTPQPVFTPSVTVAAATSSNGVPCVAAFLEACGAAALPFTLDTAPRPHNAPPAQDELLERSLPPDPGSEVSPVFTSGQTAGYLTAPYPSEAALPAAGGKTPTRVLLYKKEIISADGEALTQPFGQLSPPYPLDSASLRSQWRNNAAATGGTGSSGFTVSTGLNSEFLRIKINGVETDTFTWPDEPSGAMTGRAAMRTPAALPSSLCAGGCAGAGVGFELCESNITDTCVERDPGDHTRYDKETDNDKPPDQCSCNCDSACTEKPDYGSLKFRIPIGTPGRDSISGFLWFAMETPQPVTSNLFNILCDPFVTVETNAGAITVSGYNEGGRTIAVSNVTHGVCAWVSDSLGVLDHSWLITNPGGEASVVQLVKRDQACNTVSDETYSYVDYGAGVGMWTRSESQTGSRETLEIVGDLAVDGQRFEYRRLTDAGGLILSDTVTEIHVIGSGDSAVSRVTRKTAWLKQFAAQIDSYSFYWDDSLNPSRNGRLRFRFGTGAPWEYHSYDSRGRETLRATQLNGSANPEEWNLRGDIRTADGLLAAVPGIDCSVQTFSYTPDAASGDSSDYNDSLQPRETVSYVIRNGSATVTAREWHVYARADNGVGLPRTVTVTTVRAASATAAIGDLGNAVSVSSAYAGSEESVGRTDLWNLSLSETQEDGTLLTWEYSDGDPLIVTARRGTVANPNGLANVSTYEVETRDAAYGRTLRRETRLYTGGGNGPLLSWEENAYDTKGHLLSTAYSDGTAETNVWDCCRLQGKIGRDGRLTEFINVPGNDHKSVTGESSLGNLPGANGFYPAVETYTDALGRETNSVRRVYFSGNPANNAAYPDLATRTEYPFGMDGYSIRTDPLGVQTATSVSYAYNSKITETASAGVTVRTTGKFGGATVSEKLWTDPVSGEHLSHANRKERSWNADGCETETSSVSRNGGAWATLTVSEKDFLGRAVSASRTGYAGATLTDTSDYGALGRLVRSLSHDGSSEVYAYDALGNRAGTIRVGAGQALQFDPQSFTLPDVIALDAYVVTETPAWKESGDLGLGAYAVPSAWWDCGATVSHIPGQCAVTTSVQRVQLTGLSPACLSRTVSTDVNGATTITTEALNPETSEKTVTRLNLATSAADASVTVAGQEISRTDSLGTTESYTFDGFARQVSMNRTAGDRVLGSGTGYREDGTVAFTAELCGSVTNVTTYSARQPLQSPEGAYSVTATDPLGNQTVRYYAGDASAPYRTEGAAYPTATALDADGNRAELRTWRDVSGQFDATHWQYDAAAGLVTGKVYADGRGPAYTYTAGGKIALRTWARGVTATYNYTDTVGGRVQAVTYSDTTHTVTNRYDLVNKLVGVIDGSGTRSLSYNAKGQLAVETNSLAAITRSYDSLGMDAGYGLTIPGFATGTFSVSYGHDSAGRINQVISVLNGVTNTFFYSFVDGTSLVAAMTNTSGFGWSRSYEPGRNLITAVSNFWGMAGVSAFGYANDALGRRTLRVDSTPSLSATNAFAYNQRSEVTNAAMSAATYSYNYDDIGNRKWATAGSSSSTYTVNQLNQYSSVTNSGDNLPVTYDFDGNMTRNGAWSYYWDGENNMKVAAPVDATNGSLKVSNRYDYMKRRVIKTVTALTGYEPPAGNPPLPGNPGEWAVLRTTQYVWDGWNIAAEITVDNSAGTTNITRYVWGLYLSGSVQGAGGVGGLLAVIKDDGSVYFPCHDANGNIADYVDGNGNVVAHLEFDAFGRTLVAAGALVHDLHFWFSNKYLDEETGLYYYGYRYYSPELGKWLSRDLIGEEGGKNLLCVAWNNLVNKVDSLGLLIAPNSFQTENQDQDTCGPDVTAAVNATLNDISRVYATWTLKQKCAACLSLHTDLVKGWDIIPLFSLGYGDLSDWPTTGSGEGLRTVQFNGKCHNAGAVNFVMWGLANKLCGNTFPIVLYSLPSALGFANLWKGFGYRGAQMLEADGFTVYGFTGTLPLVPELPWVGAPKGIPLGSALAGPAQPFQWRWMPNRNPDHM